jgi:hypothetical protein
MAPINFDLPITLALTADATLFGEQLSVALYDYLLVNKWNSSPTNPFSLSAISLGEIIQYQDRVGDVNPAYRIDDVKYTYLKDKINSLVMDVELKLTTAVSPVTPTAYPDNGNSAPATEGISGHYTQYLASILFGHPLARAPIRNEQAMYNDMVSQDLGGQFMDALSVNAYANTHAIFEQFLADESTENRLSVADTLGMAHLSAGEYPWVNMPFHKDDTMSFIVEMDGNIAVDTTTYSAAASAVVPFSSIYAGSDLISSAGVVSTKKWMIRMTLDD